jgi:hypothetical protein
MSLMDGLALLLYGVGSIFVAYHAMRFKAIVNGRDPK